MAEINYDVIKTEFITTDISMNSLARKYGLSCSAISRKAKKDGWMELKQQIDKEAQQKAMETTTEMRKAIAENCITALKNLVVKVARNSELIADDDISAHRQMAGILKDLKEMGAFELVDQNSEDTGIKVSFESDVEDYGS